MFEELTNDLKIIKEYFRESSFGRVIDPSFSCDEVLDCVKGTELIAYSEGDKKASAARVKTVLGDSCLSCIADKIADCVISGDALHGVFDPRPFISACRRVLKDDGAFVLFDTVTDLEDSYFNNLEFEKNNGHVRFYTVPEIISFCSGMFSLKYYVEAERVTSFDTWLAGAPDGVKLAGKFSALPAEVKESLKLVYDGSGEELLGFTIKRGVFIFTALPES